jgi:hypothetical protein
MNAHCAFGDKNDVTNLVRVEYEVANPEGVKQHVDYVRYCDVHTDEAKASVGVARKIGTLNNGFEIKLTVKKVQPCATPHIQSREYQMSKFPEGAEL